MLMYICMCIQVRMYCETQPRFAGKSWMELFPDDSFPNDTPEDRARSKNMYIIYIVHTDHESPKAIQQLTPRQEMSCFRWQYVYMYTSYSESSCVE